MEDQQQNIDPLEGVMNPMIKLCGLETDEAIAKQDKLSTLLDDLIDNLKKVKDKMYTNKDTKIQEYLNKAIEEQKRLTLLSGKLSKMQTSVERIEKTYTKLKKDMPDLDAIAKENA